MANVDLDNLFSVYRKVGPTIDGRKPLLYASNEKKTRILRAIQRDWKKLIELHFEAEGGITGGRIWGKWRELTRKHELFKEREDLLPGILEASTPNLMLRYQRSIRYNTKQFKIWIKYPELVTGPSRSKSGQTITAAVHQIKGDGEGLGQIKRRILKKDFMTAAKKRIIEGLTE